MAEILRQRQTVFGDGKGNCWSTCIASLLGLRTEEVPNFCGENGPDAWFDATDKWLTERGYRLVEIEKCTSISICDGARVIATGRSPRGDFLHSIILQVDQQQFEMEMDPHPSDDGIAGDVTRMAFLVRA